jgi:enamine deaminase RidA (YjgF/YER057c/UK114 family)
MTGVVEARLDALGFVLPGSPEPHGLYVPVVVHQGLAYVAGQLSREEGSVITGPVDRHTPDAQLARAARACVGRTLSALKHALGDLDMLERVVFVRGFVYGDPEFRDYSSVLGHVSRLLHAVFGADGQHARSAVGVAGLPNNGMLEIEVVVAVRSAG